jgi:hypothetical protein
MKIAVSTNKNVIRVASIQTFSSGNASSIGAGQTATPSNWTRSAYRPVEVSLGSHYNEVLVVLYVRSSRLTSPSVIYGVFTYNAYSIIRHGPVDTSICKLKVTLRKANIQRTSRSLSHLCNSFQCI